MYIKKITFKAFKDYLKNPTDFFLEGNIFISDDIAKYCRLVRTPSAKGEHNGKDTGWFVVSGEGEVLMGAKK